MALPRNLLGETLLEMVRCQELIEECRRLQKERVLEYDQMTSALIRTTRMGLESQFKDVTTCFSVPLHSNLGISSGAASPTSSKAYPTNASASLSPPPVPSENSPRAVKLRDLVATLECVRCACEDMLRERPNYFGAFRQDIVLNDLRNLCDRLNFLLDDLEIGDARDAKEYEMVDADSGSLDSPLIKHVLARLFWLKHFKRYAVEVRWDVFAAAFEAEYGANLGRQVGAIEHSWGGGQQQHQQQQQNQQHQQQQSPQQSLHRRQCRQQVGTTSGVGSSMGNVVSNIGSGRRHDAEGDVVEVLSEIESVAIAGMTAAASAPTPAPALDLSSSTTGAAVAVADGGGYISSSVQQQQPPIITPWQLERLHAAFVKGKIVQSPVLFDSSSSGSPMSSSTTTTQPTAPAATTLSPFSTAISSASSHLSRMAGASLLSWGGSASRDSNSSQQQQLIGTVSIHDYDAVTSRVGGGCLYRTFQALCDPVTVVYEMGTVEDNVSGVVKRPQLVKGLLGLPVKQICCGGQHAAVLTAFGTVLTWGRGGFGRLGHGRTDTLADPRQVEALTGKCCVQVACGVAYTAAVTSEGHLYTWGAGENGRLGLGDVDDRHSPSFVEDLAHTAVQQVFAGSVHTCVLTQTGQVYSFGKHEYTGHGDESGDLLLPRLLDDCFEGKVIRQISVGPGGYHTIALTVAGSVYTWGHNRVGQLGYSNSDVVPRNVEGAHFLPTPKEVPALRSLGVRSVVAGWGHSAVLTSTGEVYICGRNYQGQLGLGHPRNFPKNERDHPYQAKFVPISKLEGKRVKQIACGGEHSVALADDGEVFAFGAGGKGQLGHGGDLRNEHFPALVLDLKRTRRDVHQVACGNNCTLILAGSFNPPSLLQKCMEVVRSHPGLMKQLGEKATCPTFVHFFPHLPQNIASSNY